MKVGINVLLTTRIMFYLSGVIIFSMGITAAINVQHLGIHPWDVLNVAMYDKVGLTVGTWAILIGMILITISLILDKRYVKLGTFLNLFLVGLFVDFFLWLDFLPSAHYTWVDVVIIIFAIMLMGIGGGMYNAGGVGSGPRDGFMLSISDKTGMSIGRIRIIIETLVLIIGLMLGGPVFIFTFIFTFLQSPLFQYSYLKFSKLVKIVESYESNKKVHPHSDQAL